MTNRITTVIDIASNYGNECYAPQSCDCITCLPAVTPLGDTIYKTWEERQSELASDTDSIHELQKEDKANRIAQLRELVANDSKDSPTPLEDMLPPPLYANESEGAPMMRLLADVFAPQLRQAKQSGDNRPMVEILQDYYVGAVDE